MQGVADFELLERWRRKRDPRHIRTVELRAPVWHPCERALLDQCEARDDRLRLCLGSTPLAFQKRPIDICPAAGACDAVRDLHRVPALDQPAAAPGYHTVCTEPPVRPPSRKEHDRRIDKLPLEVSDGERSDHGGRAPPCLRRCDDVIDPCRDRFGGVRGTRRVDPARDVRLNLCFPFAVAGACRPGDLTFEVEPARVVAAVPDAGDGTAEGDDRIVGGPVLDRRGYWRRDRSRRLLHR